MAEGGDGEAAGRTKPSAGRTNLVYWDIEMCPIPEDYEAKYIFRDLEKKLSSWGFRGPVKMRAVHVNKYVEISPQTSKDLSDSGIIVDHLEFDGGGEDYPSYPVVLDDLLDWIETSPPPANVLFITVDRPFIGPYMILREKKYNILRIRPGFMDSERDDNDYCSWTWSDIFHGGRPLIASLCYDDERTWSEICKDGQTMLAELSKRDDPTETAVGALYTRKNMKLLRNGGKPAGLTRTLRPRIDSPR